jgi:hypothetical protein
LAKAEQKVPLLLKRLLLNAPVMAKPDRVVAQCDEIIRDDKIQPNILRQSNLHSSKFMKFVAPLLQRYRF